MSPFNLFGRLARIQSWFVQCLRRDARSDRIVLVPLRLFIGLGWLRAFAEKATDSGWRDGSSLSVFLSEQLHEGDVVFPLYESLIRNVFLPNAAALAWVVMLGQLLAGLAILCGGLTNAALLGGLFMNLNFLLAGVPDPSAFYIVIQATLLQANVGAIVGVDARLAKFVRHPMLTARTSPPDPGPAAARRLPRVTAALSAAVAIYALAHVTAWDSAGSVHDPAMILAILAMMTATWSLIALVRENTPHDQPIVHGGRETAPAGHRDRAHVPRGQEWAPRAVSEAATERAA